MPPGLLKHVPVFRLSDQLRPDSGNPLERRLFLIDGAVSEVEIDEMLIRHAKLISQSFEVRDGSIVQANGNGFLE